MPEFPLQINQKRKAKQNFSILYRRFSYPLQTDNNRKTCFLPLGNTFILTHYRWLEFYAGKKGRAWYASILLHRHVPCAVKTRPRSGALAAI